MRGEGDRWHRGPIGLIADDVFGGSVLRVSGAAAVAGEEERAAAAQRRLVALGDGRDLAGVLRGDLPRECRQAAQRFPDSLETHRTASTKASSPPPPCGCSSTTVPITTKSAPACRPARACAGVRIPPPTNSGRWGTAARQARMISGGTGPPAPLPAPGSTACIATSWAR